MLSKTFITCEINTSNISLFFKFANNIIYNYYCHLNLSAKVCTLQIMSTMNEHNDVGSTLVCG